MIENNVSVDFAKYTMQFNDRVNVMADQDCTLSAGTQRMCIGKMRNGEYSVPSGMCGIVESTDESKTVQVSPIIAKCNADNQIVVLMKNETEETMHVASGESIAKFVPIYESEVQELTDLLPQIPRARLSISKEEEDSMELTSSVSQSSQSALKEPKTEENIPFKERLDELNIDLAGTVIKGQELVELKHLLGKHAYTFAKDDSELGCCDVIQHEIKIKPSAVPCFRRPYRVSPEVEKEVDKQLQTLLEQGVIEKVDYPQWSNPLLTVLKGVKKSQRHLNLQPSGLRIVVDYRHLNASSYRTHHRIILPTARELIDTIGKVKPKFFCSIDLLKGYWQMVIDESSRDCTAFAWRNSFYRYYRLPMGLANASWSFQCLMNKVLEGMLGKGVVAYQDDLIAYASTVEELMKILEEILCRLAKVNLKISPKKSSFFTDDGVFLGFKLSETGIQVSDIHLKAIRSYPAPTNAKDTRTVIGLFSFFREFIHRRATLMQPLIEVTKKNAVFAWSIDQQEAFDDMKSQLSSDVTLAFPDFDKRFIVQTDASGVGIGGILMQRDENNRLRPVCFAGRALNKYEKKTSATHLELLALVYCVVQFEVYLIDHQFDVYTDCIALKYIFGKNNKVPKRMARLVLTIESYDFTIHYKKGTVNRAADALSRANYQWDRTETDEKMEEFPYVVGCEDDDGINVEENGDIHVYVQPIKYIDEIQCLARDEVERADSDCQADENLDDE